MDSHSSSTSPEHFGFYREDPRRKHRARRRPNNRIRTQPRIGIRLVIPEPQPFGFDESPLPGIRTWCFPFCRHPRRTTRTRRCPVHGRRGWPPTLLDFTITLGTGELLHLVPRTSASTYNEGQRRFYRWIRNCSDRRTVGPTLEEMQPVSTNLDR